MRRPLPQPHPQSLHPPARRRHPPPQPPPPQQTQSRRARPCPPQPRSRAARQPSKSCPRDPVGFGCDRPMSPFESSQSQPESVWSLSRCPSILFWHGLSRRRSKSLVAPCDSAEMIQRETLAVLAAVSCSRRALRAAQQAFRWRPVQPLTTVQLQQRLQHRLVHQPRPAGDLRRGLVAPYAPWQAARAFMTSSGSPATLTRSR